MKPVTMSPNGRLTLPAPARRKLGLRGEAQFDVEVTEEGILLRPVVRVAREDVWVYRPENLARIEQALADLQAGRLVEMSPTELQAYGDEAEAARNEADSPSPNRAS
jgi:AbrB family looped-hinge helix DNA binding protein